MSRPPRPPCRQIALFARQSNADPQNAAQESQEAANAWLAANPEIGDVTTRSTITAALKVGILTYIVLTEVSYRPA